MVSKYSSRKRWLSSYVLFLVIVCMVAPSAYVQPLTSNYEVSVTTDIVNHSMTSAIVNQTTNASSCIHTPPSSTLVVPSPPSDPLFPLWNKTYGYESAEWAEALVECSGGGFAIVGYIEDPSPTDPCDFWLVRTDASGNHLWNATYGYAHSDWASAIVECSGGGFAIAGLTNKTDSAYSHFWLIRTDSSGNHLWNVTFGGVRSEVCLDVVECSGGGFALVGFAVTELGHWDVKLVRTDASGNHLWNKTYGGANDEWGAAVVECSGGGFAISGFTNSFGAGSDDMWLIRTDANGNHQWNMTYGSTGYDSGNDLVECSGGGFALTGSIWNTTRNSRDFYIVRTDASGTLLWDLSLYSDNRGEGFSITQLSDGGFAATGRSYNYSTYQSDLCIVRTDTTGNLLWNRLYGYAGDERGYDLIEYSGGGMMIAGYTTSLGAGGPDMWLLRVPNPPIWWDKIPTDQWWELEALFSYELHARSLEDIDTWWINDTSAFTIDGSGRITNVSALSEGTYGIQVWVNDTLNNIETANFTITVMDPPRWITVCSNIIIEAGYAFMRVVEAVDAQGPVTYWIGGPGQSFHFSIDDEGVILGHGFFSVRTYDVEIRAYDSMGYYCSHEFRVEVQDTEGPTLDQNSVTIEHESRLSVHLNATDISGVESFAMGSHPDFEISADGLLTDTRALGRGSHIVIIRMYDIYGNRNDETFRVNVEDNVPPVVIDPFSAGASSDWNWEMPVGILDMYLGTSDSSENIIWTVSSAQPLLFRLDSVGGNIGHLYSLGVINTGQYDLTINARDGSGNIATVQITLTVAGIAPGFIFLVLGVIAIVIVIAVVLFLRIRQRRTTGRVPTRRRSRRRAVAREDTISPEPSETETIEGRSKFHCLKCGTVLDAEQGKCTNCGTKQKRCTVCQTFVGQEDRHLTCPHCKQLAHRSHLLEWLKVKDQCPYCRRKLRRKDVV